MTSSRRWHLSSCRRIRRRYAPSVSTPYPSYATSTGGRQAPGQRRRGGGKPSGLDYRTLVEKYLEREEQGIWDETPPQLRKIYRTLARMDAPRLTIFLLYAELGSKAEVARRLGVHRSTIGRIIDRIRNELA